MLDIETVKIIADVPGGFKVINKDDLQKADRLYKSPRPKTKRRTTRKVAQ